MRALASSLEVTSFNEQELLDVVVAVVGYFS